MRPCLLAVLCLSLSAGAALAQDFPLTLRHALGTTVIPAKPLRVATVSWANQEVPLALGIVPVGMAAANFGDDDGDGVLPWVKARLDELGAPTPVLFDEGDGIDFEAVAGTRPDVILAAYSGLSQEDYDTLSKIAPVVAYPDTAWGTDWRDMIRMDSAGMGMAAEGDALIAQLDGRIADTAARFPALQGKSAMFVTHLDSRDLSVVHFYTTADARVKFFHDLGLISPKSVVAASTSGRFAGEVSAEQVDAFDDVDIVVTYGGADLKAALAKDPLMSHMPAVARDAVVMLNNDPMGTAATPTPLSIPWVLDDYAALLAKAAQTPE
ncbi:iron-siderophore ABC transporter substrate-binding protein [Falsirhodobacter sp. 20TX0035]|uniref:iron-siderophore ABC transporter substrate-binding protein n=1 Tax=Falsirhodobacter sp. 20TX0035 TaxID=3022019 RepID=UPI00232B4257|nr:iron-siderophore ABC transporter substrate-binding protein [Falsirhodobacter sp. 20TX0035]MDB6453039.1 iron-siderophore ABC transporter substrate-binding protein [Falsirhodobacter sp. 20TX0035]